MDTPERVADLLREQNRVYTVENFQVALLNTRRRLIAVHHVSLLNSITPIDAHQSIPNIRNRLPHREGLR
jgi:hypothetical protein